jgi:hypothetical protein
MTRVERLREYRSRLANEIRSLVDKHLENGAPIDTIPELQVQLRLMQDRMRIMNVEIDKRMAIQLGRKDAQKEVEYASA